MHQRKHDQYWQTKKLNSTLFSLLWVFCLTFSFGKVEAQNAFYKPATVYKQNQSTTGLIKIKRNGSIKFINNSYIKSILSLSTIDSLGINGILYKKFFDDRRNTTYLLKPLIKGEYSIYKTVSPPENSYFVSNEDSVSLITQENALNQLRRITYDIQNKTLNFRISKNANNISESFLTKIIYDYNSLKYPQRKPFKFKENWSLALGLFGGASISRVNYIGHDKGSFFDYNGLLSQSTNPTFGLWTNINPLNQLSFGIDFYYFESSGSRLAEPKGTIQPYRTEKVEFSEQAFQIPLLIYYKMYSPRFPLYFKFGPKYIFYKNISATYTYYDGLESPVFLFKQRGGFGFDSGLGLEKSFNGSLIRFEYKFAYYGIYDKITRMATNSNHNLTLKYAIIMRNTH
ncbi:hypothetical protein LAG90_16860 [Marinilongibacter aquaticus]|uniref:hypothetical protein n=1 Tax=Marinilongibacter aquaticus TaxID=2975157 RepID=UPI0021BD8975|nr:hypothetical protein [Marinilongibacter aquaticus]UBM58476.1 hypothetical protein LAG90_16860 [Marinilongibacter aquaticus]